MVVDLLCREPETAEGSQQWKAVDVPVTVKLALLTDKEINILTCQAHGGWERR